MENYDEATIRHHLSIFAKPTDQRKFEQANIYLINFLQYVRSKIPSTPTGSRNRSSQPDTDTILTIAHNLLQNPQCTEYERHYSLQIIHATVLTTADQIAVEPSSSSSSSTDLEQALSPLENVVNDLLTNGSRGIIDETVAVKEKIADIISGIAERLWPQRWSNYYDSLLSNYCNEASYELLGLSLHTLALNAGDTDFSNHLPSQRRSELVQGLCTIFTSTIFPSFIDLLENCISILKTNSSISSSSIKNNRSATEWKEIIQALILIATIMDMFSAFVSFLPLKDIAECNFDEIIEGIWDITGQIQETVIKLSVKQRLTPYEQIEGPIYQSYSFLDNNTLSNTMVRPLGKSNHPSLGYYFDRVYGSLNNIFMTLSNRKFDSFPELQCKLVRTSTVLLSSVRSIHQDNNTENNISGSSSTVNEQSYTTYRSTVTSLNEMCIRPVRSLVDKLNLGGTTTATKSTTASTSSKPFMKNKNSSGNQLDVGKTTAILESYFGELLRLLDHPSILIRATVFRSVTDFISHKKFPLFSFAADFIDAFQPSLITGLLKESRFCKGYENLAIKQRKMNSLSLEESIHINDFQDDENDEYYYAYEIVRTRVTKCLSTIANIFPSYAVKLLSEALDNGLQMMSSNSFPDHASLYGGLSHASELYVWFDALGTSVDPIIQGIPANEWNSNTANMIRTIVDTILATFLNSNAARRSTTNSFSKDTLIHDPLLGTRISGIIASFGKYFLHDTSQLSNVLDLLFNFLETSEPPSVYVQNIEEAAPATATKAEELLKLEMQYCRQRACHALVTLGRTIPSVLVSALEPLAERAMNLVSGGLLELQDTVSLIEVLVLVSNAMATINEGNSQNSFLQDILNVAIEGAQRLDNSLQLDNIQFANGAMNADELLIFFELPLSLPVTSASNAQQTLTPPFSERLSTRLSTMQYLIHVLWAMNRNCSALSYVQALTDTDNTAGLNTVPNKSSGKMVSLSKTGSSNLVTDDHNIRIGTLIATGYIPGLLGEKLDVPIHPFTEQYPVILGLILPLLRALYDVWDPDTMMTILQKISVNISDLLMVRRHILAISPDECRSLLQAGKTEAMTLAANGLGGKKGKTTVDPTVDEGDDGDDDDSTGGNDTEQITIVCIDTDTSLSQYTVTPSVEVKELSVKLSIWYNRCLLYIHSLLHMLSNNHIISRVGRHVCALSDVRLRSPPHKSSFIPIEDSLSSLWCRSGLYESSVHNDIWPMLQEYVEECCTGRNLPLRVYRSLFQQWIPGIIEGCPPVMDRIEHLSALLTPLLTTVFDTLENARNYALEIKNTEDDKQTLQPRLMRTLVTMGILPPPGVSSSFSTSSSIASFRDIDIDTMSEKVERDIYRSICDMIVQCIPTHDSWYVFLPYDEILQEMQEEKNTVTSTVTSSTNVPSITHSIVTHGVVWNLDNSTKVVALPAGSPPIITRTLLYHSSLGIILAKIIGNGITMMEDSLSVRKIIHAWERIISTWGYMLSLSSPSNNTKNTSGTGGGTPLSESTKSCLTAWIDNAMNFYTVVIEGLCLNEALIKDMDGDIIAIITNIYCYCLFSASSLTYFSNDGITLLSSNNNVPNYDGPIEYNSGPRDYLYTLPNVSNDNIDEFHHKLMMAISEKDRRSLFRDLLSSVTQEIEKEKEKTGSDTGIGPDGRSTTQNSLFGFGTNRQPKKNKQVSNLADKLVLLGRLSQGQGSSTVVTNEPLAVTEDTFIGSLFNDLVVHSLSVTNRKEEENDI